MGTSASSKGPGSGVSFDPPWLDDVDLPNITHPTVDKLNDISKENIILAPKARFRNARRDLSDYVRSGNRDSLRRALGNYSKSGMGGARNVANRLRLSTKVASNLFNTLYSLREGTNSTLGMIISKLKAEGANAYQLIDIIVENVCPNGGSIDESSCRDSGNAALREFIEKQPDADISNLSDDEIWTLTGSFLGDETFNRIQLDIGQAFERQDIPLTDRVVRFNDMREYKKSEKSAQINLLRNEKKLLVDLQSILQSTIKNTFKVFEVEV